jgi:galactose mutarotase-like enzyme
MLRRVLRRGSHVVSEALCAERVQVGELDAVVLSNGLVAGTVVLGRGADLVDLRDLERERQVLWHAPARGRSAARWPAAEHAEAATFFDHYPGGMQEIFPNGGTSCVYEGATLGFHGEACKVPWSGDVATVGGRVELRCATRLARTPFSLRKTFSLGPGDRAIRIDASIANEGRRDLDYMWGFHPAFDGAQIAPGGRLHCGASGLRVHGERLGEHQTLAPATTAGWPATVDGRRLDTLIAAENGSADLWYLGGFDRGWYALELTDGLLATMCWSAEDFPYLWLWQECHAPGGYPWFGEHHIVGIEPWTSYPASGLLEAIASGCAPRLAAGERRETTLSIGVVDRGAAAGAPTRVDLDGHVHFAKEQQ